MKNQLKSAFWGVSKTTPDANWAATMGIKAFIDCIVKQQRYQVQYNSNLVIERFNFRQKTPKDHSTKLNHVNDK